LPGSTAALGSATGVLEGTVRGGGADLDRAEVKWPGLVISLDGRVAAGPALAIRGNVVAELREISRALKWSPLSGRATVTAEISGRGGTRAIEGRADIVDLVAAGHTVDPVQASFRFVGSPDTATRWTGTLNAPRVRGDQVSVESITASLALDPSKIELINARAQALSVPVEISGVWNWSGSGRARATCGPVALAKISGVPAALQIAGTGQATVDASVDRGITS